MGGDVVDAGGGADVASGGLLTFRHSLSRSSPALHIFSPAYPTAQDYIDVVLASEDGDAAWQAAMPTSVKSWVQQRSFAERAQLLAQNQAQLGLWQAAKTHL